MVAVALIGLVGGFALQFMDMPSSSRLLWGSATVPILGMLLVTAGNSLFRGDFGLDLIAALSMTVALAFGETLAANVVALMYAGGQMLEAFASGRAAQEMTALLGRVPKRAMRYSGDRLNEEPISSLVPGDRLLVRQGEVIPVDGLIVSGSALLDQSALTGESLPVERRPRDEVLSGSTSLGRAFDMQVLRPAAESTYAGIVRLVEAAQKSKAPMARLADRYAVVFLLLTIGLSVAAWLLSGEPRRALPAAHWRSLLSQPPVR
ncbi:hypothetical protein [Pararhizobium sp. A13]|uniref:P-type ATPase n=1 Tax=Pararhizobium sp. A13 TaxID=3133975 RepID=UPI0032449D86